MRKPAKQRLSHFLWVIELYLRRPARRTSSGFRHHASIFSIFLHFRSSQHSATTTSPLLDISRRPRYFAPRRAQQQYFQRGTHARIVDDIDATWTARVLAPFSRITTYRGGFDIMPRIVACAALPCQPPSMLMPLKSVGVEISIPFLFTCHRKARAARCLSHEKARPYRRQHAARNTLIGPRGSAAARRNLQHDDRRWHVA